MDDLISRQAAIDAIHEDAEWLAAQGSDWQVERMERDKSILKSLPSAQPERKRGMWHREVLGSTSGYGTTVMYQCTNCESMAMFQYDFCPNCGSYNGGGDE